MKLLVQDKREYNDHWRRVLDLMFEKQKELFKPTAHTSIFSKEDLGQLRNYALSHPRDTIQILTNIKGRVDCAMLPKNVQINVFNSKELTRISWETFIMDTLKWTKAQQKEFTNSGCNFRKFMLASDVKDNQKDYERAYGAYTLDNSWDRVCLLTLEYLHPDTSDKHYTSGMDIDPNRVYSWNQGGKDVLIAFDTETTGLDPRKDKLVGVSVSWMHNQAIWIPCPNGKVPTYLAELLESPKIKKTAHNGKFDIRVLRHVGVRIQGLVDDSQVMAYVLGRPKVGLKALAEVELNETVTNFEDVVDTKSGETFADVDLGEQIPYACQDANLTRQLTLKFLKELEPMIDLCSLYRNVEMPLVRVLADMEDRGVAVNQATVGKLLIESEDKLCLVEEEMEKAAGTPFNANSPTEVSDLLFRKLGLEPIKSTATGFSTDKWVLQALAEQHPVVGLIIEWKKLTKMLQTYLRPMSNSMDDMVYANFNQTVTATGRLSSSHPNLQNQPPEMRKVYHNPGGKLLAADYSQQELRLLAHFSQEPRWLDAFKNGRDLHQETADLFGISKVLAKSINFGIPYGAGPAVIAQQAGCTIQEAGQLLREHKQKHPVLWKWIEETKDIARHTGESKTLAGRRRLLPNIKSVYPDLRAAAEREAVNMVIQGTAADMTKIAMINLDIYRTFNIVMQVHDEIIFTVDDVMDISLATTWITNAMEQVYSDRLTVPMVANVKVGLTWADLK